MSELLFGVGVLLFCIAVSAAVVWAFAEKRTYCWMVGHDWAPVQGNVNHDVCFQCWRERKSDGRRR